MLRTCNTLRIASLPVLRNEGQGVALPRAVRGAVTRLGRGLRAGEGGFETRPYATPRNPRPNPSSLIFDIC
ncbi:MAG: hypothetical protein LBM98_08025 [Oscillospiraceae bacterium]|nr:hypothetical protein [Oscillospiraceae bacterium]